jgi:fimbrial chaperone protein
MPRWLLPLAFLLACPSVTLAGAFGVSPIRVDLDPGTRSGLINVVNDDERKLFFQLKLYEWSQTPDGEDQYRESSDLLFFPPIFSIEPKDKRLVRVGVKAPPGEKERAFRLFIEELPDPNAPPGAGAQIAVLLRFGVPIFLSGGKGEALPDISVAPSAKGSLQVAIRNNGNRQIRFEELTAKAGDRVVAKTTGWYVFPGATRSFALPVAAKDCPVPATVEIVATAGGKEVRKSVELPPAVCEP